MVNMRAVHRCLFTIPKTIYWKIRYSKKFQAPWTIAVGRMSSIIIGKGGSIQLGKKIVALEGLSLSSTGKLIIGDKCFFNKNCSIAAKERIEIGKECSIANNVVIVDHDHDYRHDKNEFVMAPVKIEDRVWIGANCVILKGVTIGHDSVIAAGSVVRKTVLPKTLYYENKDYQSREIT